MINQYEESNYGAELAPSEIPSDLQVSAARGKLLTDSNPASDFGLNGPYGEGAERALSNIGDIQVGGVTETKRTIFAGNGFSRLCPKKVHTNTLPTCLGL